ncbi:MAG: peptidylprolyl isomerase [Candidatus Gastranaerophilales bacterium]|nr:peptidylprolyl isomerase [Candidatus Gastranaerophilales bacterium]
MKKFLSVLILMVAVMCTGCSLFKTDEALITVNGHPVTKKDYDDLFKLQNTSQVDPEKNQGLYLIIKHNVVSELVIKQLIKEEVKAHRIKVSADEIGKSLNDAYAQLGGQEQFDKFIKNVYGINENDFKKTLKEEIEVNKLIDKIAPFSKTSDGEAKGFYQKNKEALFNQPKTVRASHILIMANRDDILKEIKNKHRNMSNLEASRQATDKMNQIKAKAESVLKLALANPEGFDKLAAQYSEDTQTSKKGGDLNFFSYDEMTKSFADAAFNTKPSNIYDKVVQTDYGFHIIKVTDRKEAGIVPFDEVKAEIKAKLTQDKKNKAFQAYINSKLAKATIKYKDSQYDPKVIEKQLKEVAKNFTQSDLKGLKK